MKWNQAAWTPVRNFSPGGCAPRGLVVHVQVGYGPLGAYFSNARVQVSSHFWVGRGGEVEQYVDSNDRAWAQEAGNSEYLSVETEGFVNQPLTGSQIETLGGLLLWARETHGVPLEVCDHGGRGLTTHAHYPSGQPDPSWGGHPCPGPTRTAQLPEILADAQHTGGPVIPWPGRDLSYPPTMSGSDVADVQAQLVHHGAFLGEDSLYGPLTRLAVIRFQWDHHLVPDGIVGPLTWAALFGP